MTRPLTAGNYVYFLFLKMRQCNTNGRKLNEINITTTPFCKYWGHIGYSICLLNHGTGSGP